ncbi:MAG: flagellar hook-associated protein FlgK [Nitrospina sp.]|nr:flagellar hook-associated protein FlgK [Nitrospina sp.]
MGTNIFSVLNEGKLGLLSQQLAIEVTGNNIANVQTPGYTRQTVNLENNTPRQIGLGQLGTGVRVKSITRNFDRFLFSQTLSETTPMGSFQIRKEGFDRLELLFNETTGRSISTEMSNFFTSFEDLAANPSGLPERTTIQGNARSLASAFNTIGNALFQERQNLDLMVQDTVSEINSLLSGIAKLNRTIFQNENIGTTSTANDLRDERDRMVKSLAEYLDVTLVDEQNNQVRLTLADGTPLVLGLKDFPLGTELNGDNNGFKDILISDGQNGTINITNQINGGKLRGLLDLRDVEVPGIQDHFDRLAASLVREVNRVHREGFGLDGGSGRDFFKPLQATVRPSVLNTGSAVVSVANASPTTASIDQYRIQFTGATSFDLINRTTGASSGTFVFTPGSTFNLGNGLAVNITGTGAAGDVVDFSISENAAATLAMDPAVATNGSNIAAGLNGVGDGKNATRLSQLQNQLLFDGNSLVNSGSGAFTFVEFYNSLVSGIGVDSRSVSSAVTAQEGVMLQLNNRRESLSGVSIDEEMINLIKFQQAFAAAARLINVADEMLDILANRI